MVRDGSAQPASPTILAGTPATVTLCGTGLTTTEPAAMRAQWPISILPRIFAPAQYTMANLRMAVLVLLTGAAERDAMQDRNVVLDHSGLAADEAGRVIEENTAADRSGGIDVGLKHRR